MSRPAKGMLLLGFLATLLVGAPRGSDSGAAAPQSVRQEPGGSDWNATAGAFRGRNGAHFLYTCLSYGTAYAVYGTDIYSDDSSVCTAAVHAGRITLAGGGNVTIEIRPGAQSYKGSTRNGITSGSWGATPGSFVIVDAKPIGVGVGVGGTGWELNASRFRTFIGARFLFGCPANGRPPERISIYGTDIYTDDSSVCTAGVHAGRITVAKGGNVTIEMRPGQDSYKGSIRNGITSGDWKSWGGSFVVVGAGGAAPPPTGSLGGGTVPPPTGTPTGTVLVNGAPYTGGAIPYNETVDVTNGSVLLKATTGSLKVTGVAGVTAAFVLVRSTENKKPIVELRLAKGDFSVCPKRKKSSPGRSAATVVRQLWGNGKGSFRTRGRYAAATVRGTHWLTSDRCDGTLTSVTRGVVEVADLAKHKTVMVRAGGSYLAKP